MRYRNLGRTGIKVSPYGLRAMMLATSMGNAPEDSIRLIHKALDAGINLVDTADGYAMDTSEVVVGEALKGHRLATKVGRPVGSDPNRQGASRRGVFAPFDCAGIVAPQAQRRACDGLPWPGRTHLMWRAARAGCVYRPGGS